MVILAAAVVVLAAIGSGYWAFRLAGAGKDQPLADAVAAGFAVFGTVAAMGAWIRAAFVPLLACAAAGGGLLVLWRLRPRLPRISVPVVFAFGIPSLIAVAEAVSPVNSPDELTYKLAVPHAYQLFGRMIELPLNSHSYFVLSTHFADLAALILSGGIAAKIARLAIYFAALVIVQRSGGLLAAIALAWTPALASIAGWCWEEWPLVALLTASLDRYERGEERASFVLLGCAAATKYTALPWVAVFLLLVAIRNRPAIVRAVVIVFAFGSFFYIRNAVWTGSPFAPFLLPNAPPVATYRGGTPLYAYLFDRSMIDESLGLLLPALSLAGILARDRWWTLVGLLQLPLFFAFSPITRNVLPAFIPLAISGGRLLERRRIVYWVAAVACAAQLILIGLVVRSYELWPYLSGRLTARQYIASMRAFSSPYDWIERNTPPSAVFLLLGENRTYYLGRRFIAGGNLDSPRIAGWLGAHAGALRAAGVTHVLIHRPWIRVGSPPQGQIEREYVLTLPEETFNRFRAHLQQKGVLRYSDPEYLIYELRF
jgi:hypothetical protein